MYIMCICLFSALSRRVGALQISIIIIKGPRKAVVGNKIAPHRFKITYRSVLTFEEKKRSITHLFKTFSRHRLGCNAFILAKRSENTVN